MENDMTFMDGLFRSLEKGNNVNNSTHAVDVKYILTMEEYDSDSLIDDVKHYKNLSELLNHDFNLIKEYVYDYQCMV